MNNIDLHKDYVCKKGIYDPNFYGVFFTVKEKDFLSHWYYWFIGLLNEDIPPLNSDQEKFLEVFRKKMETQARPPKITTYWYRNLNLGQQSFVRYYFLKKLKKKVLKYRLEDGYDSIYNEDRVKLLFIGQNDFKEKHEVVLNADHFRLNFHLIENFTNTPSEKSLEIIRTEEFEEELNDSSPRVKPFSIDLRYYPRQSLEYYLSKIELNPEEVLLVQKNFQLWKAWLDDPFPNEEIKIKLNSIKKNNSYTNVQDATFHYFFTMVGIINSEGKWNTSVQENTFYTRDHYYQLKSMMFKNTRDNHKN